MPPRSNFASRRKFSEASRARQARNVAKKIRGSLKRAHFAAADRPAPVRPATPMRPGARPFSLAILTPCQPEMGEHEMPLHRGAHLLEVAAVLIEAAVVVAVLAALELALEVVVAGGAILVAGGLAAMLDDLLHPPFLGFRPRIQRRIAVAPGVVDAGGNMVALRLEHVGQIELEGGLVAAHDEQVGVAGGMDAEEGADAVLVLVVEVAASLADDLVVDAGFLDLESGRVDQEIEFELPALEDGAFFIDFGDALAAGIDEVDVGAVEGGQVVIVEARPLAHQHVPWLERLGGGLVLDDFVDAPVNAHHRVYIGILLAADFLLARHRGITGLLLLGELRLHRHLRLRAALRLPSGLQAARPFRVSLPVVADINRRWGALEDVEFPGDGADFGDDLDGARAGADDADDLVLEFGEVRARVFVVPSRGVERMAPERLHPLYLRDLGLGEGAVGADYEAGAHMVAAVGFEMPHPLGFVPYGGSDGGLEDGEFVEVVAAGD